MAMQTLNIPAGTAVLIGAPANPMDARVSAAIGRLTASIEGVVEAHLPQMYAVKVMEKPAQVLVLLLRRDADVGKVADHLAAGLPQVLTKGVQLDIWPIPASHPLADDVRRAGCMI